VKAFGRVATVRLVAPVVAVRRAAAGRVARETGMRVTVARGSIRVAVVGRAVLRALGRPACPGRRDGPCPLGVRRCVIPASPGSRLAMELRHLVGTYAPKTGCHNSMI
jgi:hypothetical protein